MTYLCLTMSEFRNYSPYKRAVGTGEGLAELGHDVYIVALDCEENRKRLEIEAPHCRPIWYQKGVVSEVVTKLRSIWKIRPDVVLDPSVYSIRNLAFLRFLFPRKTKVVVEFSELYSVYSVRMVDRLKWWVLETVASIENRYILCASQYLKQVLVQRCRKIRLSRSIIYSPYAFPKYLRANYKGDADQLHVVYMGAITYGYGFQCLLDAILEIVTLRNDVCLDVLGRGPDMRSAQKWCEEHRMSNRINFYGYVAEDELNEHLSRADVFVLPLHDTVHDKARCPSKIFYYLPYSKPIVTCAVGNPYDILGESGFYYEPTNASSMAQTIMKALTASKNFSYPSGLLNANTWDSRARQMDVWMREGLK